MNLGRPILFLIIILIAFGYIVSDDLHVRQALREARSQLTDLNVQVIDAKQQLAGCVNTVQNDQQLISQLNAENNSLKAIASRQASRIVELESLRASASERPTLQSAQPAPAGLQLPPIVLAAIAGVQLLLFGVQRMHRKDYVKLSSKERAWIIKMRRMKKM